MKAFSAISSASLETFGVGSVVPLSERPALPMSESGASGSSVTSSLASSLDGILQYEFGKVQKGIWAEMHDAALAGARYKDVYDLERLAAIVPGGMKEEEVMPVPGSENPRLPAPLSDAGTADPQAGRGAVYSKLMAEKTDALKDIMQWIRGNRRRGSTAPLPADVDELKH